MDGPKLGLINGEYYEVFNTPKSLFFKYYYIQITFLFYSINCCSYFLIFTKKLIIKIKLKILIKNF